MLSSEALVESKSLRSGEISPEEWQRIADTSVMLAGCDIHSATKHTKAGKPIYPISKLESFCNRYDVRIGIITVPADSAQDACDRLVDCGVEAIWNFAPVQLKTPQNVVVHSENLAASLAALQDRLSSREKDA